MSDSAFPMRQRFKPAPGVRQLRHGLHPSFAHFVVRIGCPALCRAEDSAVCRHWSRVLLRPRGPRSGLGYSVPVHQRLSAPSDPLAGTSRFRRLSGLYAMPKVGNHVPIGPGAVPRFLNRFEYVYGHLGKADAILGTAPGHHRLLWIHPFLDGNGRVARLMSHAVLLETLDTGAVWSAARGLAQKVAEYKRHLAACDSPRRNDLDGCGAMSEEALAAFTKFFLEVCVDQVEFMEGLMQPDALRARILLWAEEQIKLSKLPPSSGRVLEAVLYRGNLPRSGVASVAGASTRTATRIVSALTEAGVLTSDTPYPPVRLVFPAALAERWMPGLFPEKRE
jgi:Fic family protein